MLPVEIKTLSDEIITYKQSWKYSIEVGVLVFYLYSLKAAGNHPAL